MNHKVLLPFLVASQMLCAQPAKDFNITVPQFTPKAPNVAALVSAIDVPVSLYTGIPDISIPLYEIDIDGLKLPLNLSYHASGIRVAQEASWVGLGWSLNAGGLVSRTIKCGDDFNEISQPYIQEGYYTATGIELPRERGYFQMFYSDGNLGIMVNGTNKLVKDSEPDIFYYSLPNHSGKFIIDGSRGPVLLDPASGLRISIENDSDRFKKYFVITGPDGTRYTFRNYEKTTSVSRPGCLNYNLSTATKFDEYEDKWNIYNTPFEYTSSWLLTDITTIKGRHVSFVYERESYQSPLQESVSKYHIAYEGVSFQHSGPVENEKVYSCSKSVVDTWRLSKIVWDAGSVTFVTSDRVDVKASSSGSSPRKLDAIKVCDNNGKLVKKLELNYDYFNNNYTGPYPHVFKRLKFLSLTDPSDANFSYTFSYFGGSLPAKNSKNTDYWGYYNGVDQGADYYCPMKYNGKLYDGADKSSHFEYMSIGTLESFTVPTKGKTTLEYETESYTVNGSSSTSTTTRHVRDIYNVYKEYQYDTYSHYPAYETKTITFQKSTNVTISGFSEKDGGGPDMSITYDNDQYPALRVSKVDKKGKKTLIYTLNVPEDAKDSSCDFPSFTLGLSAGTYLFEAIAQCRDTWFAITCEYDYTETITASTETTVSRGGGLRVKRITGPVTKTYAYEGGLLLVDPIYGRPEQFKRFEPHYDENTGRLLSIDYLHDSYIVQLSESTIPNSTLKDGNIFGYSKVTETIGGISTTHYFHNETEHVDGVMQISVPTDYKPYNGLPIKTVSGPKTVSYYYDRIEGPEIHGFVFEEGFDRINEYQYDIHWPLLSHSIETIEEDNGTFTKTNSYTYDNNFQKVSECVTTGNEDYKTMYVYPSESSTGVLKTMYDRNMIGIPVETLLLRNGSVVDGRKTEYQMDQDLIVPWKEYRLEENSNTQLGFYSDYMVPRLVYSEYNTYGNPMQVNYQGVNTVYLWGYNGTSVVAEIKNATYDQIKDLIQPSFIHSLANKIVPSDSDMNILNNLRSQLPQSLVTTITYQPLIGVTSITDARGFKTNYSYDSSGRLSETYYMKNGHKCVVNKYEYHYKD